MPGMVEVVAETMRAGQRRRRIPALGDVLAYRNDDVIYSFRRKFDISADEADAIFADMLRYLWLCQHLRANVPGESVPIDGPLRIIDEMWHAFVLHTRAYAEFCSSRFGHFLHHQPALRAEHESHRNTLAGIPAEERLAWRRDQKRARYERVLECLGEDVFRRWYLEYPRRYSSDALASLARFP